MMLLLPTLLVHSRQGPVTHTWTTVTCEECICNLQVEVVDGITPDLNVQGPLRASSPDQTSSAQTACLTHVYLTVDQSA